MNLDVNNMPMKYLKTAVVIVLILSAWTGFADTLSSKYTDSAIVTTGTAYATARSINALISTFQTAQVSIGFASISIGELLDPINDLIERFSTVMTWCLGSLAVQKIVIAIVSKSVFQILLTLVGLVAIVELFAKRYTLGYAMKLFAFVTALRFGLFAILLLNTAFGSVFLESQIESNQQNVDQFKSDLAIFESEIPSSISNDIDAAKSTLDRLRIRKAQTEAQVEHLPQQIEAATNQKEELEGRISESWWPWGASDLTEEEITQAKTEIAGLTEQIGLMETTLEGANLDLASYTTQIDDQETQLDCLIIKKDGGSCSWNPINSIPSIGLDTIKKWEKTFKTTLSNLINLLAGLLLQNIALPLLFLWLVKRGFSYLWKFLIPDGGGGAPSQQNGKAGKTSV